MFFIGGLGGREDLVWKPKTTKASNYEQIKRGLSLLTRMSKPRGVEARTQSPHKPPLFVSPTPAPWWKTTTEGSVDDIPNLPPNEEGLAQRQP